MENQPRMVFYVSTGLQLTAGLILIAVAYFETVRLIVAWCELREDFRGRLSGRNLSGPDHGGWQETGHRSGQE